MLKVIKDIVKEIGEHMPAGVDWKPPKYSQENGTYAQMERFEIEPAWVQDNQSASPGRLTTKPTAMIKLLLIIEGDDKKLARCVEEFETAIDGVLKRFAEKGEIDYYYTEGQDFNPLSGVKMGKKWLIIHDIRIGQNYG